MENLEIILSLAATALTCLLTTLTLLIRLFAVLKKKRVAEDFIKVEALLLPFIEEAEAFTRFSGAEKKAYVLMRIAEVTFKQRIKLSTDEIGKKIDELVNLTRKVNVFSNERALAPLSRKNNKELASLN